MNYTAQIRQARQELASNMSTLLKKVEREGRSSLSESEAREFRQYERDYDQLNDQLDRAERGRLMVHEMEAWSNAGPTPRDGAGYVDARDGRAIPVLTPEQRFASVVEQPSTPASVGKFVRGILSGRWDGEGGEEARAMAEGTGSAGGHLVPTPLSAQIIDLARNNAAVIKAGALSVPMDSHTLKLAKVTSDAGASFVAENGSISDTAITLDSVTLTESALVCLIRASRQLVDDGGAQLDAVISKSLAQSLALKLDSAALYGTGTPPEPEGLMLNGSLVVEEMGANGAALTGYDELIDAIGNVWGSNLEPNAYLWAPRTATAAAKLSDGNGNPMIVPDAVKNLRPYITKQIPTNLTQGSASTASDIIVGSWPELFIGMRQELVIEVLRERFVDNLQYGFLAYMRVSVAVARIGGFSAVRGIIP